MILKRKSWSSVETSPQRLSSRLWRQMEWPCGRQGRKKPAWLPPKNEAAKPPRAEPGQPSTEVLSGSTLRETGLGMSEAQ